MEGGDGEGGDDIQARGSVAGRQRYGKGRGQNVIRGRARGQVRRGGGQVANMSVELTTARNSGWARSLATLYHRISTMSARFHETISLIYHHVVISVSYITKSEKTELWTVFYMGD